MKRDLPHKNIILNDPIYGFIRIPSGIIGELINHPFLQRLRRIKQLGLTHLVYPGAYHTRFQHALGAMHLMNQAIEVLRAKNHEITEEEQTAANTAILLHDIGHGPFSHVLENTLVKDVTHEDISDLFMARLNECFEGKLTPAIEIFENKYQKKFLHQLVASQLDMDRLDYLKRDSFFTGVAEGAISSERIIKMLDVVNDELAVEAKGIYSVENFIVSRRLMYWQVYLHKTVIAAEFLLIKILQRAREVLKSGKTLFCTPALEFFLTNRCDKRAFLSDKKVLETFAALDDYDIFTSVKVWMRSDDRILSDLSRRLVNRELFKIELQKDPFSHGRIKELELRTMKDLGLDHEEIGYYVFTDRISNSAYDPGNDKINILFKNGDLLDIADASDQLNISALSTRVEKHFLYHPKTGDETKETNDL